MKVTKATIKPSEISSEIDLDLPSGLSATAKKRVKDEAGELLLDIILTRVGAAKSPLEGHSWPALSDKYKKHKRAEGRGTKANLEFSGDMLDALEYKKTDKGVKLLISGGEAPKADGHNNFSGKSKLPERRFLPDKGDELIGKAARGVKAIIAENLTKSTRISKSRVASISSKSELNELLREEFVGISLASAKAAILVDDDLRDLFEDALEWF